VAALGGNGGGTSLTYFRQPSPSKNPIQYNSAYNDGGGVSVQLTYALAPRKELYDAQNL
jgi:hypothetical protein